MMRKAAISCTTLLLLTAASSPADSGGIVSVNECVVLLHGLARTSSSMEKMKSSLEENGYYVANVSYPSRKYKIEVLAGLAIERGLDQCAELTDFDTVHFVTHSLGGILVRYHLEENTISRLGQVVMLAPPNQGSNAVDALRGAPGFEWLNGPAGYQLGKGSESVPLSLGVPEFEFAVIAGDRTIDPVTSAVLENPDDGKVSVSDTKLEGMQDFRVVNSNHAFIMKKREVLLLVRNFLAHGSFNDKP